MKQPSFIDAIESQKEYVKAQQLGYGYTRHGNCSHYFFHRDQVEPEVRAQMPRMPDGTEAFGFIWSFKGCTMSDPTHQPHITPIGKYQAFDWVKHCPTGEKVK